MCLTKCAAMFRATMNHVSPAKDDDLLVINVVPNTKLTSSLLSLTSVSNIHNVLHCRPSLP